MPPQLYTNFKAAFIYGVVSLVLALLTTVSSLCNIIFSTITESDISVWKIYYFIMPAFLCLSTNIRHVKYTHGAYTQKTNSIIHNRHETSQNNDLTNKKQTILEHFLSWLVSALSIGCYFGSEVASEIASEFAAGFPYGLGYWFPSYIFLFIGDIFLAMNCKIIKKYWLVNPPQWLVEEQKIKAKKKIEAIEEAKKTEKQKQIKKCDNLLKICGIKFFIKYCKQITTLPIRDVTITENYTQIEKWQRLNAAKHIINSHLTAIALTKIINNFARALSEEEIENAKELLQKYYNDKEEL